MSGKCYVAFPGIRAESCLHYDWSHYTGLAGLVHLVHGLQTIELGPPVWAW
jgi:hypothetical protein